MSISSYRWTSDLYLFISRLLRYYLSACMFSMFLQFKYQLGYHDLVFCPHLSDSTFGPPLDNRLVFLRLVSSLQTFELILPLPQTRVVPSDLRAHLASSSNSRCPFGPPSSSCFSSPSSFLLCLWERLPADPGLKAHLKGPIC